MNPTKDQIQASLKIVMATADAIKELKEVPSGHLYARMMEYGIEYDAYCKIIDTLKGANLIREDAHHRLIWIP